MSYRDEVLRTASNQLEEQNTEQKLTMGAMGLAGEAGEVVDYLKKVVFHKKPLDKEKLILELGDCHWYLEYLSAALGVTTEYVLQKNTDKLKLRFPNGFSFEAANARADEKTSKSGQPDSSSSN